MGAWLRSIVGCLEIPMPNFFPLKALLPEQLRHLGENQAKIAGPASAEGLPGSYFGVTIDR